MKLSCIWIWQQSTHLIKLHRMEHTHKYMFDWWHLNKVIQFSSVAQWCLTLCNFMDCSMPAFPVPHYLPDFAQTPVHRVNGAIQPSHPLSPLLFLPSIFPSIGVFSKKLLFTSGGQSTKASASVLPMNIQAWFPLGLTVLISLLSKKLSRVFSNTTVQKHLLWRSAFFMVQFYIHIWLLEKP